MKRVAICWMLVLTLPAWGLGQKSDKTEAVQKIVVASDATWPPMEFLNANKELDGLSIDMLKAIDEVSDFSIEIRNTAWDGIFAGLANGNFDAVVSSVTITDERKRVMDFSSPYVNAGQIIVVSKENNSVVNIEDLAGKKVGAQIGTTGAIEIAKHPQLTLKNYDEIGLAIEDLANGNIEAAVMDHPIAADFVLNNDNYKAKLKIVGSPFTNEFYGIAVQKGNQQILALLEEGLQKIISSGKMAEITSKWLD